MTERYIRDHFSDIKAYASVIEDRQDDEGCTLESVLQDNSDFLFLARKYNANCILIDEEYAVDIDLQQL